MLALGLLLTEAIHVLFAEAALNESARIVTGRGVALEEYLVTAAGVIAPAEEVVEPNFIKISDTCIGGDVSTNTDALFLCALHHNGSVPANPVTVLFFKISIAGVFRLLVDCDGVNVVGLG